MVYLEKMKLHTISAGNYVTSVNGMIHPDRIMAEHDFLYILDGTFEIWEDDILYPCAKDDLLILPAGRHPLIPEFQTLKMRVPVAAALYQYLFLLILLK